MIASLESCQIFDISPEISPQIAVYPGDTPFQSNFLLDMKQGDHLTLSSVLTTVHLGAHADAPSHYSPDGLSIHQRDLSYYLGDCQVIDLSQLKRDPRHRINSQDLQELKDIKILTPRVLFKTMSFPDPNQWNDDFWAICPELITSLHHQGVKLIGIDTPSVDISDDKELVTHNAIAKCDMAILEGIVLKDVPQASYQLIALPLKLKNLDASPVRAILLPNSKDKS